MKSITPYINDFFKVWLSILLINTPFAIVANLYGFDRPLILYESFFCIYLANISLAFGILFYIAICVFDILLFTSRIYFFSSIPQLINGLKFIKEIEINNEHAIIALFFLALTSLIFILWRLIKINLRVKKIEIILISFFLILVADVLNGSNFLSRKSVIYTSYNIAGAPSFNIVNSFLNKKFENDLTYSSENSITSKFDIVSWAKENKERSILFFIVESMGVSKSSDIQSHFRKSLIDDYISNNFSIHEYEIPFSGATTSGELRSLCDINGSYNSFATENSAFREKLNDCLPKKLSALQLPTFGLHGFTGSMFNRSIWWKSIGIKSSFFKDDLLKEKYHLCDNLFNSVCDSNLIDFGIQLANAKPSFVYILTLETHLPVPLKPPSEALKILCDNYKYDDDVCSFSEGVSGTLQKINQATKNISPKPLVVIIGDHAPPFKNPNKRNLFSNNSVPAWILIPNI